MMRRIEFTVRGFLPPKKDGANSMWNKTSERTRLIELHREAHKGRGPMEPLSAEIRLTVEIHCRAQELLGIGDLDNFITGVCDGLMAVAPGTPVAPDWDSPELAPIHPSKTIALHDDRNVVEIVARKVASETGESWYQVVLVGE
jgi:hypothetical protein